MQIDFQTLRNSLIAKYSCYCNYLQLKDFFNQIPNDLLTTYENMEYFFSKYPYGTQRKSIHNQNCNIQFDQQHGQKDKLQQNNLYNNDNWNDQVCKKNISSIIKRRQTLQSLSIQSQQNFQEFTGLKNIGNNCYFNALIQLLLFHKHFRKKILNFKTPNTQLTQEQLQKIQTIEELQNLFALMIKQNPQHVDPKSFLENIFRQSGVNIQFGAQHDITEFFDIFNQQINNIMKFENQIEQNQNLLSDDLNGKLISETILNDMQRQNNIQFTSGEEQFNCIIVNVEDKNLIQGLKNKFVYNVQNLEYQNQLYDGIKHEWIIQLPNLLIVQISRVFYDQQTQKTYKNNSQFEFPEQFFMDKYLYKNFNFVNQLQDQIDNINAQIQQLDQSIQGLSNYGNRQIDILDSLNNVNQFVNQDNSFGINQQTKQELQNLLNHVQQKKEQYIKERDQLFNKKDDLLQSINQNKYRLKGIIIHDGNQIAGHYYLYMIVQHNWYIFNDTYIEKVDKNIVFKEAFGDGYSQKNAYCLAYEHSSVDDFDNPIDENIPTKLLEKVKYYENKQKYLEIMQNIEQIFSQAMMQRNDLQNYQDHQWFQNYHPRVQSFLQFLHDIKKFQDCQKIFNFCLLQQAAFQTYINGQKIDIWQLISDKEYQQQFLLYCNSNHLQISNSQNENNQKLYQLKIDYCNSVEALMDLSIAQQSLSQNNLGNYQEYMRLYFQRPQQYDFCHVVYNHYLTNCSYLLLDGWYHFKHNNLNNNKFMNYLIECKETILSSFNKFNTKVNYNELIRYLSLLNNFYNETKRTSFNQIIADSIQEIGQVMKFQHNQQPNKKFQQGFKIHEFNKFIQNEKQIELTQSTQDLLFGIQETVAPCYNLMICILKSRKIYRYSQKLQVQGIE